MYLAVIFLWAAAKSWIQYWLILGPKQRDPFFILTSSSLTEKIWIRRHSQNFFWRQFFPISWSRTHFIFSTRIQNFLNLREIEMDFEIWTLERSFRFELGNREGENFRFFPESKSGKNWTKFFFARKKFSAICSAVIEHLWENKGKFLH